MRRIHKSQPRQLEIVDFSVNKEFPSVGLQIQFPDALSPFAVICDTEGHYGSEYPHMLYALTVSGVAYLVKLKPSLSYASSAVLLQSEIMELNVKSYTEYKVITAAAATAGFFLVGGTDGLVRCFRFGALEPSAPGFLREMRDDAAYSRLRGLLSRGRTIAFVQSLVLVRVHRRQLVFVLHSNGALLVWDLLTCGRIFNHTFSASTLTGARHAKLWVGEANSEYEASIIPLAVLCQSNMEIGMATVNVYKLHMSTRDKINVSSGPSINILLDEGGGLIDIRLTLDNMWILKENGLEVQDLSVPGGGGGESDCYALQESYVADLLFQSPEHYSDDLPWLSHSVLSSLKDQFSSIVSSIFLRRLNLSGVHQNAVLRATLQDYNKHYTDSEFNSLTVDGLKKEILSLFVKEGFPGTPVIVLRCWKTFCKRYFHNWCKNGALCGLFVDASAGVVGLIRKNSISLFRRQEEIEFLMYRSSEEPVDFIHYGFEFSYAELEVLLQVLRCISKISLQLGRASYAIYYELSSITEHMSSQEVVPQLLKILDTGISSIAALRRSEIGIHTWEKEVADHRRRRKFSADIFLSLRSLCFTATTWRKVLDVIERYIKFLAPVNIVQESKSDIVFNVKSLLTVQSTSQVAKLMFESALDVLLLLKYMLNISDQIEMLHDDVCRIQEKLVQMIQDVVNEWHIINFFTTTPSEALAFEDLSSQLSSLRIGPDSKVDKRSWNEELGKCDLPLAFILFLHVSKVDAFADLPDTNHIYNLVKDFTSWIIWGNTEEESSFICRLNELALVLIRHGQFNAIQWLLSFVDKHSREETYRSFQLDGHAQEKEYDSFQRADSHFSLCLHLLGCCLLAQAQRQFYGSLKEQKVCEAVRCFFRAASTEGAPGALRCLLVEAGLPYVEFGSVAAWKLHYYQWVMQIFEQFNLSEAASQFALAALEQVDEAAKYSSGADQLQNSSNVIKGRLWTNVFKFNLDLNNYYDVYCAMISNPDEESKCICLRRFVKVLCERGAVQILCNGQLPFIGLTEKVEQELARMALSSNTNAKPNPFKLLYVYEMHRHNWQKAASYMYMYSAQMRTGASVKDYQCRSLMLQERLNGLSSAINALHLVHPAYAWIDPIPDQSTIHRENYPIAGDKRLQSYIDIEILESEFVLASAEYLLSLADVKWTKTGNKEPSPGLVDLLVQSNLYDTAFTVIHKFWRGSEFQRQLERVFAQMSSKCCSSTDSTPLVGNNSKMCGLLLQSSEDKAADGSIDITPYQSTWNHWETLKFFLEKYKRFHPRLPVAVAETLLSSDAQIELPLWLVRLFKGGRRESNLGMAGNESSPASLLQLYVNYGRYAEATNLLLEYSEPMASLRPVDIIRRKKASGVWFPYVTIKRLLYLLEEMIRSGHMTDQCEKLKKLIEGFLRNHLNVPKVDSDDVVSSSTL